MDGGSEGHQPIPRRRRRAAATVAGGTIAGPKRSQAHRCLFVDFVLVMVIIKIIKICCGDTRNETLWLRSLDKGREFVSCGHDFIDFDAEFVGL